MMPNVYLTPFLTHNSLTFDNTHKSCPIFSLFLLILSTIAAKTAFHTSFLRQKTFTFFFLSSLSLSACIT